MNGTRVHLIGVGGKELLFNFEGARDAHSKQKRRAEEKDGGVAQLGEHLPCKQGVMGSNPIISSREAPAGRLGTREAE